MTAPRIRAAVLILTVVLAACASRAQTGVRPNPESTPGGGAVAGTYGERPHLSHEAPRAVGGVTIGAFLDAFQPGTLQLSPPPPVATAMTAADGRFEITGLPPGRYFVVPIDARVVVSGQWVTVTAHAGATVELVGCSDCPPPQ